MKTTKQFALVVLMVVGATLCATTPAGAQIDLTPTGAEPGATGQASLTHLRYDSAGILDPANGIGYQAYTCNLNVACQGLTPGATYQTSAGTFQASRDGTGKARAVKFYLIWEYQNGVLIYEPRVEVYRITPDGSSTLVLWATPFSP
jgi:hypothetical protein